MHQHLTFRRHRTCITSHYKSLREKTNTAICVQVLSKMITARNHSPRSARHLPLTCYCGRHKVCLDVIERDVRYAAGKARPLDKTTFRSAPQPHVISPTDRCPERLFLTSSSSGAFWWPMTKSIFGPNWRMLPDSELCSREVGCCFARDPGLGAVFRT